MLHRLPPEALPLMMAALENPSGDHKAAFEKFVAIAEESGAEWRKETALVAAFGAYEQLDVQADADLWYWMPAFSRYRASDTFKRIMTDYGNLAFWQSHGFPPMCRPLGADDFACD